MTWYLWVWGIISTLCGLAALFCGVVGAVELYERVKGKRKALWIQLENARDEKFRLMRENDRLKSTMDEMRKGRNQWGKISP